MPDLVENSNDFVQIMQGCRNYLMNLTTQGVTKSLTVRGVTHEFRDIITQEDVDLIWRKGHCLPLEMHLLVMKNCDSYRQFGFVIGWERLVQLEKVFQDMWHASNPYYKKVNNLIWKFIISQYLLDINTKEFSCFFQFNIDLLLGLILKKIGYRHLWLYCKLLHGYYWLFLLIKKKKKKKDLRKYTHL